MRRPTSRLAAVGVLAASLAIAAPAVMGEGAQALGAFTERGVVPTA